MTATALAIAITSVLLNAAAQLFLKAGTNVVGTVSFGGADTVQTLLQIARIPWFWAGFACGISLFYLDRDTVAGAGERGLSTAVHRLCGQRADGVLAVWRVAHRAKNCWHRLHRHRSRAVVLELLEMNREQTVDLKPLPKPSPLQPRCSARKNSPRRTRCCDPAGSPRAPTSSRLKTSCHSIFGGRPTRVMTSETAALEVALQLLKIGPGDEVLIGAQTFFSSGNMVEKVGAKAVLSTSICTAANIDLADAGRRITPRTRAIIPTHYAGLACDMDALYAFAQQHKLRVIEDAALAVGSSWRGRAVGSFGDIALFSFHPNKNITTIEGGALVCNELADAKRVEVLRFHGISRLPDQTRDVDFPAASSTCRMSIPPSAAPNCESSTVSAPSPASGATLSGDAAPAAAGRAAAARRTCWRRSGTQLEPVCYPPAAGSDQPHPAAGHGRHEGAHGGDERLV